MNGSPQSLEAGGLTQPGSISLATFWSGPALSAMEMACLTSFANAGYTVKVYGFEPPERLPQGIVFSDARSIVPDRDRTRFLYKGRPNTQHFTDYFRYLLFRETGEVWIDTDMVLLRPFRILSGETIFAKETERSICNAIMRIDPGETVLPELIHRAERLRDKDLVWGATGPRLLNHVLGRSVVLKRARPASEFFPIHFDLFWMPLLPEHAETCAARCGGAFTLHLWNNLLSQLGYWKDVSPPSGSYLAQVFERAGLQGFFKQTYPAEIMRSMIKNYELRKSGGDIGIIQTSRQLLPSLGRTLRPRINAMKQLYL